jgi:hypothetical protein
MNRGAVAAALAVAAFARVVFASTAVSLPPPPNVVVPAPALTRESALLIWDGAREHLVLDLAFSHSEPKFGFLIPVPSRPEVTAIDRSPFPLLSAELPFEKDRKTLAYTGQAWKTAAKPTSAIDIYSEQRMGNFTAAIIAANDEAGLARWLAEQGLDTIATFASFRARYATLGFHFVALRYEPASPPEPGMTSQTLRLSFETPAPFLPYFEATRGDQKERRLSLWLVTRMNEQLLPVAARGEGFARPMLEGGRYRVGRFVVERTIGELSALLPTGAELSVQAFEDRKISRDGFSDVVWVPEAEVPGDRRVVATWLDPRLSNTPVPPPLALPAPAPTTPVQITTSRCATSPGAHASFGPWMLLAIALMRRRWLAMLFAVGCRRESAPAPPPAATPSASVAPPFASAERMREVEGVVRGVVPTAGIPVIAQENGAPWDALRRAPSIKLDAVAEGSITREGVLRAARASASRFRACYDLGLRTLPSLGGKVTAFITINTTGQTEKAKVTDNLPHAATVACLTSVFESLSFAQGNPAAPSSATIELEMSNGP